MRDRENRERWGDASGRSKRKKEEEEGGRKFYLVSSCSHHNGEDDEDTIGTGNGHSCRGVVAHGNRTPVWIQQTIDNIPIYTLGERNQLTSLFSTAETSEEKRKGHEAMGPWWAIVERVGREYGWEKLWAQGLRVCIMLFRLALQKALH